MSHGRVVAVGPPGAARAPSTRATEAVEVYGPPARLAEVEARGARGRPRDAPHRHVGRGAARANGDAPEGERRPANLEDVFVLLTGEEIA